jgi:hypothetical protein
MPAFRADFREPPADNGGDRTGWLGRQDSNLGMAESKSKCLLNDFKAAPAPHVGSRPGPSDELDQADDGLCFGRASIRY